LKDDKNLSEIFAFFGKTTPYGKIFQIVLKVFIAKPIDVLCSNFVKFGRREIVEIVRYLPEKTTFAWRRGVVVASLVEINEVNLR